MSKDYYTILGVARGASKDELKKAFHKKAHQHHPDKAGGDEKKFKEVNEAYQILSDDKKRSKYDQFGSDFAGGYGPQGGGSGGFSGFGGVHTDGVEFDMGDIFSEFFGGSRSGSRDRQQRGNDIHIDVTITLAEAVAGVRRDVGLYKNNACISCGSTGGDRSSGSKKCNTCGGTGKVTRVQQTILGNFQASATCGACMGGGMVYEKNCAVCKGRGVKKEESKLNVSIPTGIDNSQMIRVAGEGEAIKQGIVGDLLITVNVLDDPRFRRKGPNLYTTIPLPISTAVLGGSIDIETLNEGIITLKITPGTESGKVFRVAGKGAGLVNTTRKGDLLVTVQVTTPTKLTRQQKKLFQELKSEGL